MRMQEAIDFSSTTNGDDGPIGERGKLVGRIIDFTAVLLLERRVSTTTKVLLEYVLLGFSFFNNKLLKDKIVSTFF